MMFSRGFASRNIFHISRRFQSSAPSMSWVDYFQKKKLKNRLNLASSVLTGFGGCMATIGYIGNIEIDFEKTVMGLDPTMVMVGVVFLGGGLGYLVGPSIGTNLFNLRNRALLNQFKTKDTVFLQKIKQHRVDPLSQSFSNPVPDYYGERIYSLKDYRRWLRDCNAYRRKTKEFL